MAFIAALVSRSPLDNFVSQAIRTAGTLVECITVRELVGRVDAGHVSAVLLTGAYDSEGTRVLEHAVALRQRHPLLWIFLVARPFGAGRQALVDVASVALRVVWLATSLAVVQSTLSRAIAMPHLSIALLEVELLFATYAPRRVRRILEICAANTRRPLSPRDLSIELKTPGRTLRGRLARAGWPAPHELIAWCRLLHATFLLDVLELPAKQAADYLGYPSSSALHAAIRRHFGMSTRALIEGGGYPYLLEQFDSRLQTLGARRLWSPGEG